MIYIVKYFINSIATSLGKGFFHLCSFVAKICPTPFGNLNVPLDGVDGDRREMIHVPRVPWLISSSHWYLLNFEILNVKLIN